MLAVWILLLRRHLALIPLVTAAGAVLATLRSALIGAYPGAAAGSVIGALLVLSAAVWWYRRLTADSALQLAHQSPDDPVETATGMEE